MGGPAFATTAAAMHRHGDVVEVHGLHANREHNGRLGEIIKLVFDGHALRRYHVMIDTSTTISVLPCNVRVPGSQHATFRKLAAGLCLACLVGAVAMSGAVERARSAMCGGIHSPWGTGGDEWTETY